MIFMSLLFLFLFILTCQSTCFTFALPDTIRLQIFSNGDSVNGVNIELITDECKAYDKATFNSIVIEKYIGDSAHHDFEVLVLKFYAINIFLVLLKFNIIFIH